MSHEEELVRVYTGTEILVNLLAAKLEEAGIESIVRNDFDSGIHVGFVGGVPSAIFLFIQENDLEKAGPVIKDFLEANK